MVSALGRREWFALVALAFSVLVASTFLSATAHDHDMEPRTPFVGEPLPSPTAPPRETVEQVDGQSPRVAPAPEDGWQVAYFSVATGERVSEGSRDELALMYEAAPLPGLEDDGWRMEARATLELRDGLHEFTLAYAGSVEVTVDGSRVASARSGGDAEGDELRVLFEHGGGPAEVVIEAVDVGGGFQLRWKE